MRDRSGNDTFLSEPPATEASTTAYDADRKADGYVWNKTRLWSWRPDIDTAFGLLRTDLMESSSLTKRDFAVLVTATAAELGDSYCTLAWGSRLARLSDPATAAQVITGSTPTPELSRREAALAGWARVVVRDPNSTSADDVDDLRAAGLDDREIFEATVFVALRLAFSSVNDALGTAPDQQLAAAVPELVQAAVSFGRAPSPEPSRS
jgi:uncharacterized peroxidase-related enzyme